MLEKTNPTRTNAWTRLQAHYQIMKNRQMKDLFHEDAARFDKFSLRFDDILVDYSKNIMDEETMRLLVELAREVNLPAADTAVLEGERGGFGRPADRSGES